MGMGLLRTLGGAPPGSHWPIGGPGSPMGAAAAVGWATPHPEAAAATRHGPPAPATWGLPKSAPAYPAPPTRQIRPEPEQAEGHEARRVARRDAEAIGHHGRREHAAV